MLPDGNLCERGFAALFSGLPLLNWKYAVDVWLAGVLGVAFYFHLSGRVWCRFACPLAALMHVYALIFPLSHFFRQEKMYFLQCLHLGLPSGIDIMNFANKGLPMEDPECVRCSACVQSCPTGVLSFGRFDKTGGIHLDRLEASPIRMQESQGCGSAAAAADRIKLSASTARHTSLPSFYFVYYGPSPLHFIFSTLAAVCCSCCMA